MRKTYKINGGKLIATRADKGWICEFLASNKDSYQLPNGWWVWGASTYWCLWFPALSDARRMAHKTFRCA